MEDKRWLLVITWPRLGKTDEYAFFTLPELREMVTFLRHIQERQGHVWTPLGDSWGARCFDPEHGGVVLYARWKHTTWKGGKK